MMYCAACTARCSVFPAPHPRRSPLQTHLPGYIKEAASLKATGVDEIVCMAVNDPFVTAGWAKSQGATGKVGYRSEMGVVDDRVGSDS